MLDMRRAIVSIDAMRTQKSIALKIHEKGEDYLLALKKNQDDTYEEAETYFKIVGTNDFKDVTVDRFSTVEKSHESMLCSRCYWNHYFEMGKSQKYRCISSEREIKGKESQETRYYITAWKETLRKYYLP